MSRRPTAARIHLVRHGRAEGADGRAVGHTDLPLSAAGRRSVARLAASWSGPPPDRLIASPLARALASAEILGARWGLAPSVDRRLAEMSFGAWDGRRWDEIHATDGERFTAWAQRWWEERPPEGEGFAALVGRVGGWLDDELASRGPGGPRVTVAVTHAGPIRALLAGRLAVPREELWSLTIGPARVSTLAVDGQAPRLLAVDRAGFRSRGPA